MTLKMCKKLWKKMTKKKLVFKNFFPILKNKIFKMPNRKKLSEIKFFLLHTFYSIVFCTFLYNDFI